MTTNIVSGPVGAAHLAFATVAVLLGAIILAARKGTRFHRLCGYAYLISMIGVNLTAFGLYRLFGGFGVFHAFALLSLFSLLGGWWPARRRRAGWLVQHAEVMLWSVVGLYAAFAAEIATRLVPERAFFAAVGLSGGLVSTLGWLYIRRLRRSPVLARLHALHPVASDRSGLAR